MEKKMNKHPGFKAVAKIRENRYVVHGGFKLNDKILSWNETKLIYEHIYGPCPKEEKK